MEKFIKTNLNENVLTIILARPEKLNCINLEMLQQLDEQIARAEKEAKIKVVVLRGEGERAFSSGGDLKAFDRLTGDEIGHWIASGNRVFNRLEALSKPTLAVIQGYAFGGGLELALACDFRIATKDASFVMPEMQHGWMPGWGGMVRLRKLAGEARAKEIVFLSERYDAETFMKWGLVNKIVPLNRLEQELSNITDTLKNLNSALVGFAKSVLNHPTDVNTAMNVSIDILGTYYAKIVDSTSEQSG